MLAWILVAALSLRPATAAPADDLVALDAGLSRLEAVELTGSPAEMTAGVKAALAELKALQELAVASSRDAAPAHRGQVSLRLGEAWLALVHALMAAPCPPALGPDPCAVYGAAMAERASVMLHPARDALDRARGLGPHLGAKGRRRLARAERALAETTARVTGALPPPRRRAPEAPATEAPRVTDLGAPAPLPAGWAPAPSRADPDAAPTVDPALEWVLVEPTAWMSAQRDGGGPRARARVAPPSDGHPAPLLARLLEADGDRALLEVGPGDRRVHCHVNPPWHPAWRLRLWVDRSALLSVTTAPVQRSFDDGSAVDLRPGALVTDAGVWVDDMLLPIQPDASLVGDRYRLAAPPPGRGDPVGWIDSGTRLSIDGQPLASAPASQKADRLRAVHAVEPARHGERARQESACGSVTVRAEGRDPDGGGVAGIYGGVVGDVVDGSPIARVRIRAGTPLWWPDGAPAGALVADRTVPEDDLAPEGDGLRCLDRPLGWLEAGQPDPLDRHLSVCVRVNPTGTPSAPVTPL